MAFLKQFCAICFLAGVFMFTASCNGNDNNNTDGVTADGDPDSDATEGEVEDGDDDTEHESEILPTYWSAEDTTIVDDLNFVMVDGKPFFALGFDTGSDDFYDGQSGPGECSRETGTGFVNYQVEKNQAAAEAGANFAYIWGHGRLGEMLVAVEPPLHGIWHGSYGSTPAPENDIIPILYNAYGEEDMGNPTEANARRMADEFEQFQTRTGMYSPEAMPTLPPFEDLPWYAWHPTYRMSGDGEGERLDKELAIEFARATNMMIGDWYTYVENRFDRSTPTGETLALIFGQKGDVGEGYDEWLEWDDPDHREFFSAAWTLTHALIERRNPEAVVWLWLQGYAFSDSIRLSECLGESNDSWATGNFPPLRYHRKEITSVIAAGGTGFIFFGWFMDRWEQLDVLLPIFEALSLPEVYGPVLTSPRLDIGVDTSHLGEAGHDGLGRIHAIVKWDELSKTAAIVASNPGAQATWLELDFPWTIEKAEILDWMKPGFVRSDEIKLYDRRVRYLLPVDDGVIIRLTPLMPSR